MTRFTEPEALASLGSEFIWTVDYAAKRLGWKRRQPLWLLALRVRRLHEPVITPASPAYGGCTSWVELDGVVDDPATPSASPVLADAECERRLRMVGAAIPGGLKPL